MASNRSSGHQQGRGGRAGGHDAGMSEPPAYSGAGHGRDLHSAQHHHQRTNSQMGHHSSDRGGRHRSRSSERRLPPNQRQLERPYDRNAAVPLQATPSMKRAAVKVDMMTATLPPVNLEVDLDPVEKLLWQMREKQLIFEMAQRNAQVS